MRKTRLEALALDAKVKVHQVRRLASWLAERRDYQPPPIVAIDGHPFVHGQHVVPIARLDPAADPRLEAGKRVNLGLAAPAFDGRLLSPERALSFWRVLGRVTAADGYRPGLELRGGCLVPSIGGGLCLLSNALFALAASLGWTILERHGHTMEAVRPPPGEPWGLDATVAWPHVDLRVAPLDPVRLGARVEGGVLRVEVRGARPPRVDVVLRSIDDRTDGAVRSNRLVRAIVDRATGRVVGESIIAATRKRLLHSTERARTCWTCGEVACAARVEGPA